MKKVNVTGESKVDGEVKKYEGTVFQFESVAEYITFAEKHNLAEAGQGEAQAVKAINDFEMRRQRQNLRPSKSKATGAGRLSKGISNALKSGVSEEDIAKALAAAGVTLPE